MTELTGKQVYELIDELDKKDDTHWSSILENEGSDWLIKACSGDGYDSVWQIFFTAKGYLFVPHSVSDCISDTAMKIIAKFFKDNDVKPYSPWIKNKYARDLYDKMNAKLTSKPWEPAMLPEIISIVGDTLKEITENDFDNPDAREVITHLQEIFRSPQVTDAGDVARVTMHLSKTAPDAQVKLSIDALHRYNHDNNNSLFLVVLAQYADQRVIRPIPLTSAEAIQLAILGYQKHVHTATF